MDTILNAPFLWLLPIVLPLAVACALLPSRWRPAAEILAPWTALPALLLALVAQAATSVDVPWLLLGSRLGLDENSRVFLFFTAALWLTSGWYASGYLAKDSRRHRFLFFFLLAMSGNLGLILAQDMALFYVCFALMSFASYGLVVYNRKDEALRAGWVYIVLVIAGELLLFSGLVVAAFATGSTLWAGLGDRLLAAPTGSIAMLLLVSGLAVKAGALPLHVWLPLAHPAAPVPASAVLSGAMIKAGLIGWLRLAPTGASAATSGWGEIFLLFGLAAAFYGVLVGLTQSNPKTVLAYSSISQMGLMTVAVGLAFSLPGPLDETLTPTLVYAMHHGLAKGALFLGVGIAAASFATAPKRWLCALGLVLPALALAGMPLTSGALAKAVLKSDLSSASGRWPEILALLLPWAAVGTTLLLGRFLWLTWPKPHAAVKPLPPSVVRSWSVLLALVLFGTTLWPWGPDLSAGKLLVSPEKISAALWPVLVGTALAGAVAFAAAKSHGLAFPRLPAGDVLWLVKGTATPLRRGYAAAAGLLASGPFSRKTPTPSGAATDSVFAGFRIDWEIRLCRTPAAGIALLAVAGTIIGLLALAS